MEANLQNTDLLEANLHNADLRDANLTNAVNLEVEQLLEAKTLYKARTTCWDGGGNYGKRNPNSLTTRTLNRNLDLCQH